MNRILKPALVVMAVLAISGVSVWAETVGEAGADKDISGIAKKAFPSVVRVEARNHTRRMATGVVIDKEGYVVTTALMSPRDEKITITTSDGKTMDAEFLGFDTETQLAVLRAKEKGLGALSLGKSEDLAPGSWVCAVGISPEGAPAVTQGIVSSVAEDRLRLNIWVTPGSSGGPVLDEKGEMVGLLRGIYSEEQPVVFQFRDKEQVGSGYVLSRAEAPSSGMAVAVPIDVVRNIASQIREKGRVERGWLGVNVGLNDENKVEIAEVDPQSPAELAKLKEGDIILKLDDKDVTGRESLAAEIRKRKPGQDVVLRVDRDGKPLDVRVKLGAYSEDEAKREMELRFPRIFPPSQPGAPQPPSRFPESQPAPRNRALQPPARPFDWSFEKRKYIGVYANPLTRELAEHFGVKNGTGLLVSKLTEKGPAEKAGVKVGDVIVRVDGQPVENVSALSDLVQQKKKGDKVKFEIVRDKKPLTLEVPVEEEEVGGGILGAADLRSLLESWQGYTDAFQSEIKKWDSHVVPEIRDNLGKIGDEVARNTKDTVKRMSRLVRQSFIRI